MKKAFHDKDPKRISFNDIANGLNRGLESADPLRLAGLERLARVRAIKETSFRREQERLTAKFGADHPRVVALQLKQDANRDLLRDVKIGILKAQTPLVRGEKDVWTLHGHVRKTDRSGVGALTVALYDRNGEWRQEFGYSCTDQNGYFKMDHRHVKAGKNVYIRVMNAAKAQLFVDEEPLVPEATRVEYREILLDDNQGVCQPPDDMTKPEEKPTRYLGNSAKREVHDLDKKTSQCQLDEIRSDRRVPFKTKREATAAGYDFCAYCFGKDKSKR